jgi:hypothetical protein
VSWAGGRDAVVDVSSSGGGCGVGVSSGPPVVGSAGVEGERV